MTDSMPAAPRRGFLYYDMLVAGMVAVLLCSNLIGPAKVSVRRTAMIGALSFGAGNLFFPIGYIFGDVLTEVYGYARARRAIWAGFGAMVFATVMAWAVILAMPASPSEPFNRTLQPALETVFGGTGRIAIASMIGLLAGRLRQFLRDGEDEAAHGRHGTCGHAPSVPPSSARAWTA